MLRRSSDPSPYYNCIAFAAGEDTRWWWPDPHGVYYWPLGVQREITVAAFVEAFRTLGYEVCKDGAREAGFEKIVLYAQSGRPTHAARLLSANGLWISKLGPQIDVEHDTPEALTREMPALMREYGDPVQFMKRSVSPT